MNAAHAHLLFNHAPALGCLFGSLLLASSLLGGIIRHSEIRSDALDRGLVETEPHPRRTPALP